MGGDIFRNGWYSKMLLFSTRLFQENIPQPIRELYSHTFLQSKQTGKTGLCRQLRNKKNTLVSIEKRYSCVNMNIELSYD